MDEDTGIDKLLDEADEAHKIRIKLQERLKKPIVRSFKEFLDEEGRVKDSSPFYVIVHANEIEVSRDIDEKTRKKLLDEIAFIKQNFDHTSEGPFRRADVPGGRPILVCGAYDAVCVGQQHDLLIKGGFDAYISKEGTLPFNPNNKPAFE